MVEMTAWQNHPKDVVMIPIQAVMKDKVRLKPGSGNGFKTIATEKTAWSAVTGVASILVIISLIAQAMMTIIASKNCSEWNC